MTITSADATPNSDIAHGEPSLERLQTPITSANVSQKSPLSDNVRSRVTKYVSSIRLPDTDPHVAKDIPGVAMIPAGRSNSIDITSLRLQRDPSRRVESRYDIVKSKPLGSGGYASVYVAQEKYSGEYRAVKIIPKHSIEDTKLLERELSILLTLDHPNVIRMYEWFEDAENVYLIMELCDGGDLLAALEDPLKSTTLTPEAKRNILRQILLGVAYIHERSVIHRDIKLENCVFKSRDIRDGIKLIDYGLAGVCENNNDMAFFGSPTTRVASTSDNKSIWNASNDTQFAGTGLYLAPEVVATLLSKESDSVDATQHFEDSPNTFIRHSAFTHMSDVWSIGVLAYVLLTKEHPFSSNIKVSSLDAEPSRDLTYNSGPSNRTQLIEETRLLLQNIVHIQPDLTKIEDVNAADLIGKMLDKDPRNRPNAIECLEHKWLRSSQFLSPNHHSGMLMNMRAYSYLGK